MPATEPRRNHAFWQPVDQWAVPLYRGGAVRISLSYLVFVVAAIIIGAILIRSFDRANGEVIVAMSIGASLWIGGWILQGVTFGAVSGWVGWPVRDVTIGLFGVQFLPRRLPPSALASIALATLTVLLASSSLCWLIGSRVEMGPALNTRDSLWVTPSLGGGDYDTTWLSAAWLLFVQSLCQVYPLSHSIGRNLLAAAVGQWLRARRFDDQLRNLRRMLLFVALGTMLVSIGLLINGQFPGWLVCAVVATALWISSEGRDVPALIQGLNNYQRDREATELQKPVGQWFVELERQRRARRALRRERDEAADADRLDEVLSRLHQGGADSLSREDRKLLRRISQRVRQQRDADDSSG